MAIAAGRVLVAGTVADKPARLVAPGEPVLLSGAGPRFVSRGGDKLDAALTGFDIVVDGVRALDAGASTGGFTDCLLQRGAASVCAVDVGYGQLDARLRHDPRVEVRERTNVRYLTLEELGPDGAPAAPFDLVVADLSFISLSTVVSALVGLAAAPGGHLVLLVKPQFEAGRAEVSRGKGVIRDRGAWSRALDGAAFALQGAGTGIMGAMTSPVAGPAGNTEFFLHAVVGAPALDEAARSALVDAALPAPPQD